MAQIFVSYSRKDLKIVQRIKNEIEENTKGKCWMDLSGIDSGTKFVRVIVAAINKSDIFLFFLSKNSLQSEYALREINYAKNHKKRIVLINIDNSKLDGEFEFLYSDRDQIDYSSPEQKEKLFRNIKEWIGFKPTEPRDPKPHYFNDTVFAFQIVQCVVLLLCTLFFGGLFCVKGPLRFNGHCSVLLIIFMSMIMSTVMLKKHKIFPMSFIILDVFCFVLLYLCLDDVYAQRFNLHSGVYKMLIDLTTFFKKNTITSCVLATSLWSLHNTLIWGGMKSRIVWRKIKKLRNKK